MLSSSPSVMDMVPSLLPERNENTTRVIRAGPGRAGPSRARPRPTFKVVEDGALAEGGLDVVKLVVKLRVQVLAVVSCYAAGGIYEKKEKEFPHYKPTRSPSEKRVTCTPLAS